LSFQSPQTHPNDRYSGKPALLCAMKIRTTEPGLQVYDGANINIPVPGLDGFLMGPHAGIALEPQVWPDTVHHPDFPLAVPKPGATYQQHTHYAFRKDTG
jgi:aldose 1-epimerase